MNDGVKLLLHNNQLKTNNWCWQQTTWNKSCNNCCETMINHAYWMHWICKNKLWFCMWICSLFESLRGLSHSEVITAACAAIVVWYQWSILVRGRSNDTTFPLLHADCATQDTGARSKNLFASNSSSLRKIYAHYVLCVCSGDQRHCHGHVDAWWVGKTRLVNSRNSFEISLQTLSWCGCWSATQLFILNAIQVIDRTKLHMMSISDP